MFRKISLAVSGLMLATAIAGTVGTGMAQAAQATMAATSGMSGTMSATMASTMSGTMAAGKSHYVGWVPPALTSPFHVKMRDGALKAAADLGWKLEVQSPASESDFAGQVTLVQQLIQKGVEAVSINPIQVEAMITGVKAANAANIPVFMHNFITPLSQGNVTEYVGYDQWGGAEKLGIYTCGLLAKKYSTTPAAAHGKVYILLGIESIFSHRRTQGYQAGITETCPGVTIVGQQTAEWDRAKGADVAAAALQKTPDIDVFYGNSDEMAIGASLAATKLGLTINKDFFAIAIDGNDPTLDLIKQGKFTATLGVDPYRMGQTVVTQMQKVLNGEKLPQFLLTPSTVVDASNITDYVAGKLWTAPVAGSAENDNGKPTVSTSGAATMAATMNMTMAVTMAPTAAK